MRRFFSWLLMTCLLFSCALAEDAPMTRLDAAIALDVQLVTREAECYDLIRTECGNWTSVRVIVTGMVAPRLEGTQVYGMVYETETARRITWEELFVDPQAAQTALEEAAQAQYEFNSYSQYDQVLPLPTDQFTFENGVLTLWYPASQLSSFSGHCGALSLYPGEMEGLYSDQVPEREMGELKQIFETRALPAPLNAVSLGDDMLLAHDAWGNVDVPDETYDYALYRFEDAAMNRGAVLAKREETQMETAKISGIMTEHFELFGLMTGKATMGECLAVLGEADEKVLVSEADGYSRLDVGESLLYHGQTCTLELHFTDDILRSVALLEK